MGVRAQVHIINETGAHPYVEGEWRLYFQWCRYLFTDGETEHGYRFIWRRGDGSLQAAMGQARIPSIEVLQKLVQTAKDEGWGDYDGDNM